MKQNLLESYQRAGRSFAFFLGLTICSTAFVRAQTNTLVEMPPPAPRRPSIILILADSIGYGDLGCYGQTKIKTPNLDKLAAEGIRFTSFYTGSPDDATARAALFTGLEPRHLHAGFNQVLPGDAVTLGSFLKQQGYRTGLIGTWGLGDTASAMPDKNGFDEFGGFLNTSHARDYFTDRIWRTPSPPIYENKTSIPENEYGKRGKFVPDLLSEMAVNFVRINKSDKFNKYRPFFLCLAYPFPHVSVNAAPPGTSPYADAPWPPLERIRASQISRMDEGIGRVLGQLEKLKISTNTIVVFAGVGGPEKEKSMVPDFFRSGGMFRGQQGSLNEAGLRVPLIVRWPAEIQGGAVSDLPCAAWDILPTTTELAFKSPPKNLDGFSLLPTLLGQTQTNRHDVLYWETHVNGFQQAVRLGNWKAIRSATNQSTELYDLKTDAGEKQNLAAKNPEVMAKIEKIFNAARKAGDQP